MTDLSLLRVRYMGYDGAVYFARDRNGRPEHAVYDHETGEFTWHQHPKGGHMTPLIYAGEPQGPRCPKCSAWQSVGDNYACETCAFDFRVEKGHANV